MSSSSDLLIVGKERHVAGGEHVLRRRVDAFVERRPDTGADASADAGAASRREPFAQLVSEMGARATRFGQSCQSNGMEQHCILCLRAIALSAVLYTSCSTVVHEYCMCQVKFNTDYTKSTRD